MADEQSPNFSTKERFSYAYVDGVYAKIAVNAGSSPALADPLMWSYAETHSYVEVDPASIGVSAPSGVSKVFAKAVYLVGGGGGGGGSAPDLSRYATKTELSAAIQAVSGSIPAGVATTGFVVDQLATISVPSALSQLDNDLSFATLADVEEAVSSAIEDLGPSLTIPVKLSDLEDDLGVATTSYVDLRISEAILPSGSIPLALSDLENDVGFATSAYVDDVVASISVPPSISAVSQLINDAEYATTGYVAEAVAGAAFPEIAVPSALSQLEDDIGFATRAELSAAVEEIHVPEKVSELENDEGYATSGMLNELSMQVSNRLLQLESMISQSTSEFGDRTDSTDMTHNVQLADRLDESTVIDFGSRL